MKDERQAEVELGATLESDLRQLSEGGLEPERDLWPDLAGKIHQDRHFRPGIRRSLWAAAIVILALGVTWQLVNSPAADIGSANTVLNVARSRADLPSESSATLRAAFISYVDEREVLLLSVLRELDNYPPDVRSEVLRSIEVIETEMKEIERSLARLPVEPSTEMRLADLYDMELRLLSVVSERLRGSQGVSR